MFILQSNETRRAASGPDNIKPWHYGMGCVTHTSTSCCVCSQTFPLFLPLFLLLLPRSDRSVIVPLLCFVWTETLKAAEKEMLPRFEWKSFHCDNSPFQHPTTHSSSDLLFSPITSLSAAPEGKKKEIKKLLAGGGLPAMKFDRSISEAR